MHFDFADLLLEVLERKASDLHLTAGAHPTVRIRGRLVALEEFPVLTPSHTREVVYGILTNDQRQRLETDWQLDFAYAVPGTARFRVNAFVQRSAVSAAFRHIPTTIKSIEDLGLPAVMHEFAHKPRGFVLVTGPTGSGKSTSLAASSTRSTARARTTSSRSRTRSSSCTRTRVPGQPARDRLGRLVVRAGIKAALRQDPDVILVGEMRDLETIHTALTAAETGHLVFATLHTQDAPQTIDRIIDVFPPASSSRCACSSRSPCRASSPSSCCRRPTAPGRVAACEVLVPTPRSATSSARARPTRSSRRCRPARTPGCRRWTRASATLVRQGKITQKLAEQRSSTPGELSGCSARAGCWRHEHVRLQGDRRQRARGAAARSTPTPSSSSPTSSSSAGLIVLAIDDKGGLEGDPACPGPTRSRPTA
jgi:twitching motility protein PilT